MPRLCFEEHQSLAARAGVSVLAFGGWGGVWDQCAHPKLCLGLSLED